MKVNLAICSLIVGMSGHWENVATMLNIKLDFYCRDNSVSFCKSSHIAISSMEMLVDLLRELLIHSAFIISK